uniref:Uncharacterized protein n=1 Tax=Chromera velia CCMP2878 TaxID=1169474 RepID=A0A0G4GZQ9_9ALVE|eukprot:Cvel_24072.t1-p1 / transcript=Cvel_24072.t1 / gene=Cvel_24072 / organism=Chromera_velia_CCMP2878 / gene_product=hypothetical protein / transcript_product=hypothetical protein / location=Cvel_scaffold2562:18049-20831(+) / protein_length=160 / sequence_SO=supercontig / SO=protein_coding / is_pseudo=false
MVLVQFRCSAGGWEGEGRGLKIRGCRVPEWAGDWRTSPDVLLEKAAAKCGSMEECIRRTRATRTGTRRRGDPGEEDARVPFRASSLHKSRKVLAGDQTADGVPHSFWSLLLEQVERTILPTTAEHGEERIEKESDQNANPDNQHPMGAVCKIGGAAGARG